MSVWLFKTMLNQNGNGIISVQGTTVSPAFRRRQGRPGRYLVGEDWPTRKIMPVGQHSNAEKKFLSGNIAFLVATSARIANRALDERLHPSRSAAIPMPYWQKPSVALGGNVLIILSKDQKMKEASWKLVKYLASKENQTAFALKTGYLPIRKSGLSLPAAKTAVDGNNMFAVAFDQLDVSWSYWHFEQMGTMDMMLAQMIDVIERNVQDPKAALNKAAADLQVEIDG